MIAIIIIVTLLTAALLCYSIYKSDQADATKLLSLPGLLLLGLLLGGHYLNSLGSPIEGKPDGEWSYIHHSTDGVAIQLWVDGDRGHRLHVFPYNEDVRKELEKAMGTVQQGRKVVGEFKDGSDSDSDEGDLAIKIDKVEIPKH